MDFIMGKCSLYPAILTVVFFSSCDSLLTKCHRGSYYLPLNDGQFVCPLCLPGTFMTDHDHINTDCRDCMKVEDDRLEILITPCNGTHDAVIHCVSGYYRKLPRNSREKERCEQCGECGIFHEILPCRIYADVHCCADDNFEVLPDTDGVPGCVERQWFCKQGEYFNTQSYQCFSCPDDTFMPMGYHSMTECFKCHGSFPEHLPKHGMIIHPCNKTHQAVVGCKDGFYINQTMGYQSKDIGCSPCKTCNSGDDLYQGRECGPTKDTVCCPQPNMMVVDTAKGPECRESVTDFLPALTTPRGDKGDIEDETSDSAESYYYLPDRSMEDSSTQTDFDHHRDLKRQRFPQTPPVIPPQKETNSEPNKSMGFTLGVLIVIGILGGAVFVIMVWPFCPKRIKGMKCWGKRSVCLKNIKGTKCWGKQNHDQQENGSGRDEGHRLVELQK